MLVSPRPRALSQGYVQPNVQPCQTLNNTAAKVEATRVPSALEHLNIFRSRYPVDNPCIIPSLTSDNLSSANRSFRRQLDNLIQDRHQELSTNEDTSLSLTRHHEPSIPPISKSTSLRWLVKCQSPSPTTAEPTPSGTTTNTGTSCRTI